MRAGMFQLENETLRVVIDAKGAELKSIFHKEFALEYMWNADPKYWAKSSPVLFPIVGALKTNTYFYNGKSYTLPRHGFARDKTFEVTAQQADAITFSIKSDAETLPVYPFPFALSIHYKLANDSLTVTYEVMNTGKGDMFFSIGAHPAFKVPLVQGTAYDDYKLIFEKAETAPRWPISKEGLIEREPEPLLDNTNELPLTKDLFGKDALVFKHLQSQAVRLQSDKTTHGLQFSFPNFPYLGLWAAPGADFVCIEPWCGIADSVDTDQQLEHKEGMIHLEPATAFSVQWHAQFY
jgi:galactose mutarotase-like enzyme